MEQKPGSGVNFGAAGTPNPLNPSFGAGTSDSGPKTTAQHVNPRAEIRKPSFGAESLDANPSEAMPSVQPLRSTRSVANINGAETPRGVSENTVQPMGVITDIQGMPTEQATTDDPSNRPMQKAVEEAPKEPKKKKTGLIVGAIVSLVLALGCGVAAATVIVNLNHKDAVVEAFGRLFSGEAPTNLAVDGTIGIDVLNENSYITDVQIALTGEMTSSSVINTLSAKINLNTVVGRSYSLAASEVYAADGDLYLKLDGITNLLSEVSLQTAAGTTLEAETDPTVAIDPEMTANPVTTEGTTDQLDNIDPEMSVETEMPKWLLIQMTKVFEVVDGEWLRIPTDNVGTIAGLVENNAPICSVKFITELSDSSNSLVRAYNHNPFIGSTTENLKVTSEQNPIYQLTIDTGNLAEFFKSSVITTAVQNYDNCLGTTSGETTSASEVAAKVVAELPELYVEIDDDYNFTRFYTEMGDESANVKVDLRFSYPNNVNISEPVEYKDFSTILEEASTDSEELEEL